MAAQLSIVANNLIENIENTVKSTAEQNIAGRGGSRVENIGKLKRAIAHFHKHLGASYKNVLEGAERKQLKDPEVKKWLDSVKDAYYEVVDACRELQAEQERAVEKRKGKQPSVFFSGLDRVKEPFLRCSSQTRDDAVLQTSHEVDAKRKGFLSGLRCRSQTRDDGVLQISDQVGDLSRERDKLNLKPQERVLRGKPKMTIEYGQDKDDYGRDVEKTSIIARMRHLYPEPKLVTILGEAGIGKTALARRIYEQVKPDFDIAAWVNVSEGFKKRQITRDFVEGVTFKKINKNEFDNVEQRVSQIIRKKRFLLVLDGVQDTNDLPFKWRHLMKVFNSGGPGCTILMTTRQESIVIAKAKESFYKKPLAPLSENDCRSIIEDQAFGTDPSKRGIDVNKIYEHAGRELVAKCNGLPVIAKAIGSILRGRTSLGDWEKVRDSDIWTEDSYSKDKPHAVKATMLSYYCLPSRLRQCLLYCSIFPKRDYIDVNKLISLWMAQDCLRFDTENKEGEAWKCFKKLLRRSIFQEYFKKDGGGNFVCKLHSAMSDFIHDLVGNECYIMTLDKTERKDEAVPERTRHCTLNVLTQASLPKSISGSEKLHTLMLFSEYSSTDPESLSGLLMNMRMLRALDLSYCSMKSLPDKACELKHLRYLNLSFNRDLSSLPESLCSLFNLQTLNLNGCDDLQQLPRSIEKLTNLRHLDILWTTSLSYLPKGLTSLTSLTRLSRFLGGAATYGKPKEYCNLGDLQHLNKLQGSIAIEGLGCGEPGEAKDANLKDKKDLLGLELWFSVLGSESHDNVLEHLEPPPQLEILGIFCYRGSFRSFPPQWTYLEKLTHLILSDCTKCYTLPPLGKLQSLQSLEIRNFPGVSVVGFKFVGDESDSVRNKSGFGNLKNLHFERLQNWTTWHAIGDPRKHMPQLSSLTVLSCPKLKSVPKYIKEKDPKCKKEKEEDFKIEPLDFFEGKKLDVDKDTVVDEDTSLVW